MSDEHWYDREARENTEDEEDYMAVLRERYNTSQLKKPGRNTGY